MGIRVVAIVVFGFVGTTQAQVSAEDETGLELQEPSLSPDAAGRRIGAGLLGFGLSIAASSAPVALLEIIVSDRHNGVLAAHAALAGLSTAMIVGGIVRLVRTQRNAIQDRRRLRRRLVPLVLLSALTHAVVTTVTVFAGHGFGAGAVAI